MDRELIIAIPGPWKDRSDFLSRLVTFTNGEFIFAGNFLVNPKANDHVIAELYEADPHLQRAFEYAGQGKLQQKTINAIAEHKTTIYLHFPLLVSSAQARLKNFTTAIRQIGGYALKIESSGNAHEWEVWDQILDSDNPFDLYRGFVTLIGDEDSYYSCGMHHFSLPDSQVSKQLDIDEAADLLNRFNYYRILENPLLEDGHTFSLSENSPWYKLSYIPDHRHEDDDLFHNPFGLMCLNPVLLPE
jgi:hypothetical protein